MKLSETIIFSGISEEEISGLMGCLGAIEKKYKKGSIILSEGEPIDSIGVVISGMAIISHSDIWGNNSIMGNAGPGDVFAETYACIPGKPLQINVIAVEDTTVLFINVSRILTPCNNACSFHTKMVGNLLSISAAKCLSLSNRIINTTSKSIRGRLLSYFSECTRTYGSNSFEIPFKRQQLADYLNVDRSNMCNELSKMQKEGIIEYKKNHFTIKENLKLY